MRAVPASDPSPTGLAEVARAFTRLGLSAFGGPVAHLGALRAEIVERRRWCADTHFAELVALCQFLPGPASSQLVFALGMERAGLAGALVASLCFTLPSAFLMLAFAIGVAGLQGLGEAGWLHGLKVAAVAVVAHAVWGMARSLCPDRWRRLLALAAAAGLSLLSGPFAQVAVIGLGAALGLARRGLVRRDPAPDVAPPADQAPPAGGQRAALAALALFAALLVVLPLAARTFDSRALAEFDAFYRAGALVFGGGHVILPLLRAEVVPTGWLSDDLFLAGYGAVQAVPGPLFTLATYLGAAMHPGPKAALHGLWTLWAIFLPSWLLIGGALPFWRRLRGRPLAQAAVAGANAAVVGLLIAALYRPLMTEALRTPWDNLAALAAIALMLRARLPAWALMPAMAAAGQWLLP